MSSFTYVLPQFTVEKSIHDIGWNDVGSGESTGNVTSTATRTMNRTLGPSEIYELAIAFRAGAEAIARNGAQARPRLFTRTGREIIGGPLFNLFRQPWPKLGWASWFYRSSLWWVIAGERAILKEADAEARYPTRLRILNPFKLSISTPTVPVEDRTEIDGWCYRMQGSREIKFSDDRLVFDREFSPTDPVRGCSKFITGAVQAGISHYAPLYAQMFFQNDTTPGGIVRLPENTPRKSREEFSRRMSDRHAGVYNAHKWFTVSGESVELIPFDQKFQDGNAFMETQRWAFELAGSLLGVPPIEMHYGARVRYETANEERRLFVESTLQPMLSRFNEALQLQLVNSDFAMSEATTEKPRNLTRSMRTSLERAVVESGDPIVLLLDTDTMPIMGAVKAQQVSAAQAMRTTLGMSPTEVIEYFGFDVDHRPERDDVFMPAAERNITHPEKNMEAMIAESNRRTADAKDESPPDEDEPSGETVKAYRAAIRRLRKMTLESLLPKDGGGELWGLRDVDSDLGPDWWKLIRRVRFDVRQIVTKHNGGNQTDLKNKLKDYFNRLDPKFLAVACGAQDEPINRPKAGGASKGAAE